MEKEKFSIKRIFELFATFFKIGLFTFGGGYAMIGIIEDTCVEKKKWITHDDMMTVTVIAESTPGPIAINCSTFVGYKQGGFLGSVAATCGVVMPSFIIIYLISLFFDSLLEVQLIANAFRGIQVCVGFIIIQAGFKLKKKMKDTKLAKGIFYLSLVLMMAVEIFSINFSTMTLMVLVGAFCAALCFVQNRNEAEK